MNKTIALILVLTLRTVAVAGRTCGPGPAVTEAPTERPTQVPTEAPALTPTLEPTPTGPSLGGTRTRPADGR